MGVVKGRIMNVEGVKWICKVIARWGQKHVIIYTLQETTQAAGAVETFESRQWITPLLHLFEKPA